MKQSHLGGRCRGLRPSQQRQLERLSHRRHPENSGADLLSLERLADLVLDLEMPLHMVLDGRGLCRLLWLGRRPRQRPPRWDCFNGSATKRLPSADPGRGLAGG